MNPLINAGDAGDVNLIPGSGRSPGGGSGNLLQYFCLKSPMGRGGLWSTGCAKSWTRLSTHTSTCNSSLVSMLLIPKIVIRFLCLGLIVLVNNFYKHPDCASFSVLTINQVFGISVILEAQDLCSGRLCNLRNFLCFQWICFCH